MVERLKMVVAYLTNSSLRYDCYLLDLSAYIREKKEFTMKETPMLYLEMELDKQEIQFLLFSKAL